MKLIIFLFFLITSLADLNLAYASIIYGHNLSQTIETNKKGEVSLGSYVASYGLADDIMLATSTWLFYDYNSWSLILKKRFESMAIQTAYIKTYENVESYYNMEALVTWFVKKFQPHDLYEISLNLNYMHFFNETIPFSFRREPGNNQPYQYSLSTLHRLTWTSHWGGLLEFGLLGINYKYPQVHSGFGAYYQNEKYLVQLGASMTARPYNVERFFSRDRGIQASDSLDRNEENYYDYSLHPEIQFQYFL